MGFMLPDLKNHSKSAKRFRLKTGKSWSLKNGHFSAESRVFLVPPGAYRFSGLLRAAGDRFYDKKIDFYDKKSDFRLEIESTISKSTGVLTYSSFGLPGTCFSPVL